MKLNQAEILQNYRITSVQEQEKIQRRLEALGLTEGSLITILNNDKKGSLTAKFRGTRFAFGRRIADHIEVMEVQA